MSNPGFETLPLVKIGQPDGKLDPVPGNTHRRAHGCARYRMALPAHGKGPYRVRTPRMLRCPSSPTSRVHSR